MGGFGNCLTPLQEPDNRLDKVGGLLTDSARAVGSAAKVIGSQASFATRKYLSKDMGDALRNFGSRSADKVQDFIAKNPKAILGTTAGTVAAGIGGAGFAVGHHMGAKSMYDDLSRGVDPYYKSAGLVDKIQGAALKVGLGTSSKRLYGAAKTVYEHPKGAIAGAVGGTALGTAGAVTGYKNYKEKVAGGNNMYDTDFYGYTDEDIKIAGAMDRVRGAANTVLNKTRGIGAAIGYNGAGDPRNRLLNTVGNGIMDHPKALLGGIGALGAAGAAGSAYAYSQKQAGYDPYYDVAGFEEPSFDDIEIAKMAALELSDDALSKLAYAESLMDEALAVEEYKVAAFEGTKQRARDAYHGARDHASQAAAYVKGKASQGYHGAADATQRAIAYAKANPKKVLGIAGGSAAAAGAAGFGYNQYKKRQAEKMASDAYAMLDEAQAIYDDADMKLAFDNGSGSQVEVGNNLNARASQPMTTPQTVGGILGTAAGGAAGALAGRAIAAHYGLAPTAGRIATMGAGVAAAAAGLAGGVTVGGKLNDFNERHRQARVAAQAAQMAAQ